MQATAEKLISSPAPRILIVGKPNCGKSLFFNSLTGLNHKVSNFPGVTVEVKSGTYQEYEVIDFPGLYSTQALSRDEHIAIAELNREFEQDHLGAIFFVADITCLESSLKLADELSKRAKAQQVPFLVLMNMADQLSLSLGSAELDKVSKIFNAPCFLFSARKKEGFDKIFNYLRTEKKNHLKSLPVMESADAHEVSVETRKQMLADILDRHRERSLKTGFWFDHIFLSPIWGGLAFLLIMTMIFQSVFTWAVPMMDLIESILSQNGQMVASLFSSPTAVSFVKDALFGGIGAFLVFVPQIFMLTLVVGILEDSGYLARAALICHRPLSFFGLSGKSFVPLLTGHACAIPAIYAARTIESPRRRRLTMLVTPLMACSARLPVYGLLVATLIPNVLFMGGFIGLQGLVFAGLYLLGIVVALVVSVLVGRITPREEGDDTPFIMELPAYRWPHWRTILPRSFRISVTFVKKAGPIIFLVTGIVWALGYFPGGEGELDRSFLSILGKFMEPVFAPLGLDWKFGVAVLTSFLAREVFVGTLGTLFGIENSDEDWQGLSEKLSQSELTLASGFSLLVFYAIALQCVSTVAVLKDELGSKRWALAALVGFGVLAYVMAFLTYRILS